MEARSTAREPERGRGARARLRNAACSVLLGAFAAFASTGSMAQVRPFPAEVVNTATVQADSVFDPDSSNNVAQDRNARGATADLSITKTLLDAGPFLVGQVVRYSIAVANAGPSAASSVTITDTPDNLEIVSVTGACDALPCTLDALPPLGTASLEVAARIREAGVFGNIAAVSSADVDDPDGGNNQDDGGGGEAGLAVANIRVAPERVDEDAGQALVFTIEFDVAPGADTQVQLAWGGTAGSDDYTGAVTSVTVPAGERTVSVSIVPVADTVPEPDETVVATLVAAAGYTPGTASEATGTIVDDDRALLAVDDTIETPQNAPADIDVLANDRSGDAAPAADAVDLAIAEAPASGTATIGADGRIRYVPGTHYSGADSFTYRICPAGLQEGCSMATVRVTVLANRIEAVDDTAESDGGRVEIDVLANDSVTGAPLDPASLAIETPPQHGAAGCAAGLCHYEPEPGFEGEDRFAYRVCDLSVPQPVCATASVVVTVALPPIELRLAKQAAVRTVSSGDLVRYSITVTNVGEVDARGVSLLDATPPGFTFVEGSLRVADEDGAGAAGTADLLRIDGLDVPVGGTATVTYYLRVGAGVGPGVHRNVVVARDPRGRTVSNEASAEVVFEADPLFADSLVVGTVFDDRDGNGWQAPARATGVKVRGGFALEAYVPGTTTIDRGHGPEPVPDASAPLLRGLDLGTLPGRSSPAAAAGRVEVRQVLRESGFTGDFELATAEGTRLRMDAQGRVEVERGGEVARGRNAQDIRVSRQVGQVAEGVEVRYVIRNEGIDERGVPGVRLATVEGLLIETDAHGRYHIAGVDGGGARGRNFIVKVDPGTLPPGTGFTTPNPLVQRITPGIPVRFDFGARLPDGELRARGEGVTVELGEVLFAAGSAEVTAENAPLLDEIATRIAAAGGAVVTIHAEAEGMALAFARAEAVREALDGRLPAEVREAVRVELSAGEAGVPAALALATVELGEVLFALDSDRVRPAYEPLLEGVARRLAEAGGGTVTLVGRTDRSGGEDYNQQLGLRRARAVFEALAARLPEGLRARLRVDVVNGTEAGSGTEGR